MLTSPNIRLLTMITGATAGGGGTRRWSDTVSLRKFRQSALYHDLFRPLGVRGQLGSAFPVTEKVSIALGFNRALSDFTREEVALVKAFVPHVRQLVLRMIGRQEVANALALREHAREAGAALIVDENAKVWFANDAARKLLADYFPDGSPGPDANPGELPLRLRAFLRGKLPPDATLTIDQVTRRLVCTAGPLTRWRGVPLPAWMHSSLEPRLVRCVRLQERCESTLVRRLQGLGLTPRESEVLRWLMEGKRNHEIALILGANPNTIRTHVQQRVGKAGCRNPHCRRHARSGVHARRIEHLKRCRSCILSDPKGQRENFWRVQLP